MFLVQYTVGTLTVYMFCCTVRVLCTETPSLFSSPTFEVVVFICHFLWSKVTDKLLEVLGLRLTVGRPLFAVFTLPESKNTKDGKMVLIGQNSEENYFTFSSLATT
jgi:hypothetical protein